VVCTADTLTPSSSTSECPVLDSDRDTTFDDFDLENNERLEVAEMFQSSSLRSLQGRRGSESDAVQTCKEDLPLFSIDIPSSYRSHSKSVLLTV